MNSIRLVAIRVAVCLALIAGTKFGSAQSASPPKDSAKTSTVTAAGDEAFADYQHVTAGITPPKATHSPDPQYPEVPADTDPHGVVVMLIGVDTRGHVGPVHVLRSSGEVFEKSAVSTVKTWRFKPAKQDGRAVPVQITVEMNFAK